MRLRQANGVSIWEGFELPYITSLMKISTRFCQYYTLPYPFGYSMDGRCCYDKYLLLLQVYLLHVVSSIIYVVRRKLDHVCFVYQYQVSVLHFCFLFSSEKGIAVREYKLVSFLMKYNVYRIQGSLFSKIIRAVLVFRNIFSYKFCSLKPLRTFGHSTG